MYQQLSPLFPNPEKVIVYQNGKYPIQVEIPRGSDLTEAEIERILRIASWERDMNQMVDGFVGGRGVSIKRDRFSYNNGITEVGLQISGVGYIEMRPIEGNMVLVDENPSMKPPESRNIYEMEQFNGLLTTTESIRGDVIEFTRRRYAPLGSYTESGGKKKIQNMGIASSLGLNRMTVPRVRGYGRYLTLEHEGEPFLFMIYPIPSLLGRFVNSLKEFHGQKTELFLDYMFDFARVIGEAMRELHDKGWCHRQPHWDNFYYFPENDGLYVMDWSEMRKLNGLDVSSRAIDVRIVHQDLETYLKFLFRNSGLEQDSRQESFIITISVLFLQEIVKAYFGRQIFYMDLYDKVSAQTGISDDVGSLVEIMKILFLEEIKIGRNVPCPCGSGRKFKQCCMRELRQR